MFKLVQAFHCYGTQGFIFEDKERIFLILPATGPRVIVLQRVFADLLGRAFIHSRRVRAISVFLKGSKRGLESSSNIVLVLAHACRGGVSTYTHVHNTIVRVPYGSVMYWSITWVLGTELPVWFASGFVHAC